MGPLELGDGIRIAFDLAVAVAGANLALDRAAATAEGAAMAAPGRGTRCVASGSATAGQAIEWKTNKESERHGECQCRSEPGGNHDASRWCTDDWRKGMA
jgi:hypothetical protein